MKRWFLIPLGILMLMAGESRAADRAAMLEDWVEDFRRDPVAETPFTFGIRVDDTDFHVVVSGERTNSGEWGVELAEGFPADPCVFFKTDAETLAKLHRGELASLTAMGKAFSTDFAPLDMDFQAGFRPGPDTIPHVIKLAFHFWTRGFPEVVRFGDLANTRVLHGANATLFYYQEGFRSGWFSIGKGQHVNADEASRTNPFPSLFVITRGSATAKIDGEVRTVSEGEAIYIGPGVSHEFWNDQDERAEGILVMFGDGA